MDGDDPDKKSNIGEDKLKADLEEQKQKSTFIIEQSLGEPVTIIPNAHEYSGLTESENALQQILREKEAVKFVFNDTKPFDPTDNIILTTK